MSHKTELPGYDVGRILDDLLNKAKQKDEFEYASTLLRFRGCEDPGWDPLIESNELINQMATLIQAPLADALKMRLFLFLYCHATEMYDLYGIVGNMLRVIHGERYTMIPFAGENHPSGKKAKYPSGKVERIVEWAQAVEMLEVGDLFQDMLIAEVRNAFFHSDYILYEDAFHIRRGKGVPIGNLIEHRVKLSWLMPRLNLGVNLALALIQVTLRHIRSYKENKVVLGRIQGPSPVEVELTTHPKQGLAGFRSPPQRNASPPTAHPPDSPSGQEL